MVAKQNGLGVTVLKWKDRRDVFMITTKHGNSMNEIQMKRVKKVKPNAIIDYNRGKGLIYVSDQIGSYHTCLRKGVKWYRKIAFDIICNTAFVNAFSLYKADTNNRKSITQFREDIALEMIKKKEVNSQQLSPTLPHHTLVRDKKRARCYGCYRQCSREEGKTFNYRILLGRIYFYYFDFILL